MALTRKMLKAMGIEDEKIDQIIEAHTEVTDGLKTEAAKHKADAEKLPGVQQKLDALEAAGDDGYKEKYDAEHDAFEKFKNSVTAEKETTAKSGLYRKLLEDANVDKKRIDAIMKVTDLSNVTVKDGKIDGSEAVTESIKKEWSGFIVSTKTGGAQVDNPPSGGSDEDDDGEDLGQLSMADYIAARKKM